MDKKRQEEKSVEEKLELSAERFRIFVKHTPAAVAMFDNEMRYIAVSDRWLEDYNITDEDVIGKFHYEVFPGISDDWVEIYQICLTGITKKGEDTVVTKDGKEEWVQWEIHPWYESSGEVGGIIIYADLITSRKETELKLMKAREQAEEASRAKSSFIANMSHEFRTPLNAILGYAQVLQNSGELTPEQRKFVDEISDGGKQLLSMINNIIDLSKIETSRIEYKEVTFSIEQLIKGAVELHIPSFKNKGLTLKVSISAGVPKTVSTDFHKLDRILRQLINNALKFTENGGIEIGIGFEKVPQFGTGVNGMLSLFVSDTGIGIAEKKRDLIFKPFSKIHPETSEGTGLGLTLVQRLIRFLGGKIDVQSSPDKGSEFKVFIPVKASADYYAEDKQLSYIDEVPVKEESISAKDISSFIQSLGEENKKIIKSAIEMQDLEKLSTIEQHLNLPSNLQSNVLVKLKTSAQDLDFKFLSEVQQLVE